MVLGCSTAAFCGTAARDVGDLMRLQAAAGGIGKAVSKERKPRWVTECLSKRHSCQRAGGALPLETLKARLDGALGSLI